MNEDRQVLRRRKIMRLKIFFLAAWLMLSGLALEAGQPALETDGALAEAADEALSAAGADQAEALKIPEEQRLVRTDLVSGLSDHLSLFDFVEGSFDWLISKSAFARANSSLEAGWEDMADLETTEQYSLVAYGPRDDDEDHWLVAIRYNHNNQKLHYDFDFVPDGDKMALKTALEGETPLEGKHLKELLTEIFGRAAKHKK